MSDMIKKYSTFFIFCLLLLVNICQAQTLRLPISQTLKKSNNKTNLTKYLNKKKWNELFPKRYGLGMKDTIKHNPDFYSFEVFVKAAKIFPDFLASGDDTIQKRELAAFLANVAQETSGGWTDAPGGYFKWGLYFLEENNGTGLSYADTLKKNYPPVAGKYYYGRGPKQISWNYNYGQFSEAWYGDKQVLLNDPSLLARDPLLSFASGLWFWMTAQYPKPSCHNIICGIWQPTSDDLQKGRLPGFGGTVNVINGGVECNGKLLTKTDYRYRYYQYFCDYFHVAMGNNVSCAGQRPFGQ